MSALHDITAGRAARDRLLADADRAAAELRCLVGDEPGTTAPGVVALVAHPVPSGAPRPPRIPRRTGDTDHAGSDSRAGDAPGVRDAITRALGATCQWLAPSAAVPLTRPDHGLLLAAAPADSAPPPYGGTYADEYAAYLAGELREVMPEGVERAVVGVGRARPRLADARGSYNEALLACRVAALIPELGHIVHWSHLGVYGPLARLPTNYLEASSTHPGLERLFGDHAKLPLLETLEVYLDLAGNAHDAARTLHVHRATLYYRLQRVEELAAANLKDGAERLCLHLALKIGRLTGRYVPRTRVPAGRNGPGETVAGR